MKRFSPFLLAAGLLLLAGAALAANTDLQVLSTSVVKYSGSCTALPPQTGSNTCFTVTLKNNGPDTYNSSGPGPNKVLAGGRPPKVTVDIDEPTEPGKPLPHAGLFTSHVFTKTDSFFVTIPSGGTVNVTFTATGWVPTVPGGYMAGTTVTAQGSNVDSNPGNDSKTDFFNVFTGTSVPAAGVWALLAGGLAMLVFVARRMQLRAAQSARGDSRRR